MMYGGGNTNWGKVIIIIVIIIVVVPALVVVGELVFVGSVFKDATKGGVCCGPIPGNCKGAGAGGTCPPGATYNSSNDCSVCPGVPAA